MFRLYVDEVGTDDLVHLDKDKHRYLSLTGVAMRVEHARDILEPALNRVKADVFNHDPDEPLIFHRKDILGGKGVFGVLRENEEKRLAFDRSIIGIARDTPYSVITALIDKAWMLRQKHWRKTHPYHYLMEILVEKYVQFLERNKAIGDIMPEARKGNKDTLLQKAFDDIKAHGTHYVKSTERIHSAIRSNHLKFRDKPANVAGLQLCDLLAHPSHMNIRRRMGHDVNLGPFATQISSVLERSKYDRSWNGSVMGYGIKHLP